MFACKPIKMERIPLPCAFYSAFRIPNFAFAPLQNASTYGKIERADESQRNIGSDDRETVARGNPPCSESRRVVRGGRAHGVNLHPASFSRFREAGQPYRPSSGGNGIFPCRKTSGTADSSVSSAMVGRAFFHPQWSFTVIRRNIRNEREDRSPEKQL